MLWNLRFVVGGERRSEKVAEQFAPLEQGLDPFSRGASVVRSVGQAATAAAVAMDAGSAVVETNGHVGEDGQGNFTLTVRNFPEAGLPLARE